MHCSLIINIPRLSIPILSNICVATELYTFLVHSAINQAAVCKKKFTCTCHSRRIYHAESLIIFYIAISSIDCDCFSSTIVPLPGAIPTSSRFKRPTIPILHQSYLISQCADGVLITVTFHLVTWLIIPTHSSHQFIQVKERLHVSRLVIHLFI